MLNKRNSLIALLAFSAAIIISSCGGGGSSNTGQGGPDISPDQYTDTNTPAVDTANTEITGTTTAEEGTVVEPIVETKIEGSLDTSTGDTGLADAETILDGVAAAGTDTTASNTTSSTTTGTTDSGSTSSTATGTTDSGSTSSTATGTTASDTTSTTSTDTAASGSTSGTGTTVTGEPVVSGDAVNPLENDEAVNQTGLDYSIDSSKGRWFEETKTDLFSESDTKSVKAEIKALREEIKTVLASYKNGNTDKQNGKARIKQIREKIAALRSQIGNGGRVQQGIYTNWANENLYLNIKKGEPGWYRIIIVAKNRGGTLPEDYSRFTFSVNNSSNDTVAGISVKASDNVYFRGSADVYLENPSGAQLNLLWTNDAYIENKDNSNGKKNSNAAKSVYDTNINIKKVVLKKIKEPGTKTVNVKHFNGDEFSSMDGRWFFENKSAYTFWSNQVIGYTFKNLEEGEYEVTITAKNYDSLPLDKNYKEFNVEVDSDYDSATMNIRADDKNWNHEKVTMNFAEGDTTLFVTWTNDSYKEGEYDSNIMIKTISIKKVQKSSLTAFLLRTKPGNKVFILGAFLMLSGLIFGIYLKNKTSHNA